jgi:uncharacterized protein YaaW (UPF0174 family)
MITPAYSQGLLDSLGPETPEEFTKFIDNCALIDKIKMVQSLRGLDIKINDSCYGKLVGLNARSCYAEDKGDVTPGKPLLPKTFNDVLPETVSDAISKGHLSEEEVSTENIMKKMVWRRYNKMNYLFHRKKNLDYHNDYVVWAAKKLDVPDYIIKMSSTFELEREIFKAKFAQVWDKLTIEQRKELLSKIESENGSVGDKVAIASLSGAAAIATLSTTVAFTGFAFYTSLTTAMSVIAGCLGVTLPFTVYTTATTSVALLSGPIGWTIAGAAVIGGGVAAGWPDKEQIIAFIMTVNIIKAPKYLK